MRSKGHAYEEEYESEVSLGSKASVTQFVIDKVTAETIEIARQKLACSKDQRKRDEKRQAKQPPLHDLDPQAKLIRLLEE